MHITTAADRLCAVLDGAAKEGREVEMWRLFGALTMEVRSPTLTMQPSQDSFPTGTHCTSAGCLVSAHVLSMPSWFPCSRLAQHPLRPPV